MVDSTYELSSDRDVYVIVDTETDQIVSGRHDYFWDNPGTLNRVLTHTPEWKRHLKDGYFGSIGELDLIIESRRIADDTYNAYQLYGASSQEVHDISIRRREVENRVRDLLALPGYMDWVRENPIQTQQRFIMVKFKGLLGGPI